MKQQPSPEKIDLIKNTFRASMPLTDDYVFHAVFGRDTEESRAALIEILNIILERKQDPIRAILIKNPIEIPDREAEKNRAVFFLLITDKATLRVLLKSHSQCTAPAGWIHHKNATTRHRTPQNLRIP